MIRCSCRRPLTLDRSNLPGLLAGLEYNHIWGGLMREWPHKGFLPILAMSMLDLLIAGLCALWLANGLGITPTFSPSEAWTTGNQFTFAVFWVAFAFFVA